MADLKSLIRLRRFELEDKQRIIARLLAEVDRLLGTKENILRQGEIERDMAKAAGTVEAIGLYLVFDKRVRYTVQKLNQDLDKLEGRIAEAQDEMREAFGELKKIEITQDVRLAARKAELQRREMALFDDIALTIFRRQMEESNS